MKMEVGSVIICGVEKLAHTGQGVAWVDGMTVFVQRGLPGQVVRARIVRAKKTHAFAVVRSVLEESAHRVEPFCEYYPVCGGCHFQDLAYARQLEEKRLFVRESLERIGRLESPNVLETLASPRTSGFRNNMQFAFEDHGGDLALGLHGLGDARVFNLDHCPLMDHPVAEILETARTFCSGSGFRAYDSRTGRGLWRFLALRTDRSGRVLAHVITSAWKKGFPAVESLAMRLGPLVGQKGSVVHGIRRARSPVAKSEETRILHGPGVLYQTLGGKRFSVGANAFFQVNPQAAELLASTVVEFAEAAGARVVYDLYCGAGAFSLLLASETCRVTGFEVDVQAVENARANADLNRMDNLEFVPGDLARTLADHGGQSPEVVVSDPPRSGMASVVVDRILELCAERVVLVSCNPATLARDLARLNGVYGLVKARPVDLFPHTGHVESVVLLTRRP